MRLDDVRVPADRLTRRGGRRPADRAGRRWTPGGSASPRCAVGLAQAALDDAVAYAKEREPVRPGRSSTTRAWRSCSPTWPPRSRPPGRPTCTRPGCKDARPAVRRQAVDRQADRHRHRDEGDHRRRAGARRLRLHPRLPGRALHARGQGDPDLRGHQPDPADGHQPLARQGPVRSSPHRPQEHDEHPRPRPLRARRPARPHRHPAPWSPAPTPASASTPPRRSPSTAPRSCSPAATSTRASRRPISSPGRIWTVECSSTWPR